MAYGTDLTTLTDAQSGTWTEFTPYSSGGTPAADGENFIQGTDCRSQTFGSKSGLVFSVVYDAGSDISGSFSAGDCLFMWHECLVGTAINTYASGGMRIGIGSSITAINSWYVGGSDYARNPYGGWQNSVVDPTLTADYTDGGGNGGAYRYFGSILYTVAVISKGTPHAVDAIRYGRGEIYCTGTGCTFSGMAQYNDYNDATNGYNRFGLFSYQNGTYLWKGLMSIGQSGTSATFTDSNKSIIIDDAAKTYLSFNKIEFRNSGSTVSWDNISFKALGTVSPGQLEVVENGDITINGCTFQSMDTFIFMSGCDVTNTIFQGCKNINSGGGVFTGTKVFASSVAADASAFTWNVATDPDGYLDNMQFSKGTNAHHAINFGTSSPLTMTLRGIDFSGFNASNSQNDSTLYIARTSGSETVVINLVGCSGNISYKSAGAIVSLVIDPVTLSIEVRDISTGLVIENARILVEVADGTNFPYQDSVSITGSGTTATVTHTAHGLATNDNIVIRGVTNDDEYNGAYTITKINDNSYSYTTNETITSSPATGTITATMALINGLTNSSGIRSDSRTYTVGDQDIVGWVRKSSSSPYYQQQPISDTVDSLTGKSINIQLIRDE